MRDHFHPTHEDTALVGRRRETDQLWEIPGEKVWELLLFAQRLEVLTHPDKNLRKAEFMPCYRAIDKSVSVYSFNFKIEAVASEENVSSSEGDALVAVNEAFVVTERLHQGCRFLIEGTVIAGLGAKNGGFNGTFIADTMATAKHLDQSMLHTVDFGYRQEVRHLFGETLQ
jgi:hypothetical protein